MPAGLVENAELAQQIADVGLNRALGEPQSASDSCVGQPLCHEREHHLLALGENGQYAMIPIGGDQLGDHLRVQR
jgi:hypothetical protein